MLKEMQTSRCCSLPSRRKILMTCLVSLFTIGTLINLYVHLSPSPNIFNRDVNQEILDCLTEGHWVEKQGMTERDYEKVRVEFLEGAWQRYGYSGTNQRADSKCGNVTNGSSVRAICDPRGSTPCCYNNKCVAMTTKECRCQHNCFDMRQKRNAELHTWKPICSFKMHTTDEACQLLRDQGIGYISVIGDSLQRNLYSALVMTLSEDRYITTEPTEPIELRERCLGWGHYSNKDCYLHHIRRGFYSMPLCGGSVHAQFKAIPKAQGLPYALFEVLQMCMWKIKYKHTAFLFSIGIHDDFSVDYIANYFIRPLCEFINRICEQNWLKVIWVTPHLPGILKPPFILNQQIDDVKRYVERTNKILKQLGIPILNTHNLTADIVSWDGTHYGPGLNEVLANIVLNYLNKTAT